MPAEWEPHAGTWMLWPERPDNWRDNAAPAQRAFAAVAAAIARSEPVTMGVSAGQFDGWRGAMLPAGVRVVEISSNDAWMRDVGPTFVVDRRGRVRGVDWMFNAWGGKAGGAYADWELDDQVAAKVLEIESKRALPRALHPRGRRDPRGRAGHAADDRGMPAGPEPQPDAPARADREPARALSRRARDHLAGARRLQRRDRRPRGQPLLLRAAGRGRAHLVRRTRRIRSTTSRARRSRCSSRRRTPRPAAQDPQADAAGAALHERGGGGGHRALAGLQARGARATGSPARTSISTSRTGTS